MVERRRVQMRYIDEFCVLCRVELTQMRLVYIGFQRLKVPVCLGTPPNPPWAVGLPTVESWRVFVMTVVTRYT